MPPWHLLDGLPARARRDHLKVSERNTCRDISDLIASQRVPIENAAGIGYSLSKGYDVPPLMFTESELDALAFGAGTQVRNQR